MIQEAQIPIIPEEVAEYLRKLRKRERKMIYKKQFLKTRFLEMGGRLKLLEARDEELPCMVASKNVYQLSTVRQVREYLVSMIGITSEEFVKCYLELKNLRQDLQAIQGNLHHAQLTSNRNAQN